MAILKILLYPNPVLRQQCQPVSQEELASETTQTLIKDMIETMYNYEGTVGLAAPQVGVPLQIMVMDATAKTTRDRLFVVINPVIIQQSQWKYSREGCLSFPDYLVTVKRARKLTASCLNQYQDEETLVFKDFEAIIFQHEWDHLQGILFIDRVKNIQTDILDRNALSAS